MFPRYTKRRILWLSKWQQWKQKITEFSCHFTSQLLTSNVSASPNSHAIWLGKPEDKVGTIMVHNRNLIDLTRHLVLTRKEVKTRMHSSRMRTVRCSGRLGGRVSAGMGVCLGGCTPPPCEQNYWQTGVKTSFADGNYSTWLPQTYLTSNKNLKTQNYWVTFDDKKRQTCNEWSHRRHLTSSVWCSLFRWLDFLHTPIGTLIINVWNSRWPHIIWL